MCETPLPSLHSVTPITTRKTGTEGREQGSTGENMGNIVRVRD